MVILVCLYFHCDPFPYMRSSVEMSTLLLANFRLWSILNFWNRDTQHESIHPHIYTFKCIYTYIHTSMCIYVFIYIYICRFILIGSSVYGKYAFQKKFVPKSSHSNLL